MFNCPEWGISVDSIILYGVQLLSFQVDGEKKIISTATEEEAPPFAFAVYSQVDKEKRKMKEK